MHRLVYTPVLASLSAFLFPFLFQTAAKGFALLAVAVLAAVLFRRASASVRHLVWVAALAAILALPGLSLILPAWNVLPAWLDSSHLLRLESEPVVGSGEDGDIVVAMAAARLRRRTSGQQVATEETSASFLLPESARPLPGGATGEPLFDPVTASVILLIWAVGGMIILFRLGASQLVLWNLARCSQRVTSGRSYDLLQKLRRQLRIRREVRLLTSARRLMPMTWGIYRSYSLLPAETDSWETERLRAVLLHELGHIKRWDNLVQLLAQVACALHWFNPLAWFALRRVHVERERACDDFVLSRGLKASEYAGHLLGIVTGYEARGLSGQTALAMAKKARLEGRLVRLLNARLDRRRPSPGFLAAVFVVSAGGVLGLGMMRAQGPAGPVGSRLAYGDRTAAAGPDSPTPVSPVENEAEREAGKGRPKRPADDMTTRDFGKDCLRSGCHASLKQFGFFHGPLAVGACDDCHEIRGKEADHEFRLSRSEDDLCTSCHVPPAGAAIHAGSAEDRCLDCHDPHGGRTAALLRSLRVLYLEGTPRWESRFLKTLLLRDKQMDVRCYVASAGPGFRQESSKGLPPLSAIPARREALFEYDVILVGDLPRSLVEKNPKLPALLQEFVYQKGGGLVSVAGPESDLDSALAAVLPVSLERSDRSPPSADFSPRLTRRGSEHEILRLVDDPKENLLLWERELPSLYGYRQISAVKPGAEILCVNPEARGEQGAHPLIVLARLGRGRSLFVATDSLWRWRSLDARYCQRFWKRVIIYMACGSQRGG